MRTFFAPARAENDALEDAAGFNWTPDILNRDRDLLRSLGSLNDVITHHSDLHKSTGLNPDRVEEWLSDDPNFEMLMKVADKGGEVDVDDDFVPSKRTAPLRNLQRRLLPVYRKHAHKMWDSHRGLLLRLSDLDEETLASMHIANDCHWTPKPANPLGRFLAGARRRSPAGPQFERRGIIPPATCSPTASALTLALVAIIMRYIIATADITLAYLHQLRESSAMKLVTKLDFTIAEILCGLDPDQ